MFRSFFTDANAPLSVAAGDRRSDTSTYGPGMLLRAIDPPPLFFFTSRKQPFMYDGRYKVREQRNSIKATRDFYGNKTGRVIFALPGCCNN